MLVDETVKSSAVLERERGSEPLTKALEEKSAEDRKLLVNKVRRLGRGAKDVSDLVINVADVLLTGADAGKKIGEVKLVGVVFQAFSFFLRGVGRCITVRQSEKVLKELCKKVEEVKCEIITEMIWTIVSGRDETDYYQKLKKHIESTEETWKRLKDTT